MPRKQQPTPRVVVRLSSDLSGLHEEVGCFALGLVYKKNKPSWFFIDGAIDAAALALHLSELIWKACRYIEDTEGGEGFTEQLISRLEAYAYIATHI